MGVVGRWRLRCHGTHCSMEMYAATALGAYPPSVPTLINSHNFYFRNKRIPFRFICREEFYKALNSDCGLWVGGKLTHETFFLPSNLLRNVRPITKFIFFPFGFYFVNEAAGANKGGRRKTCHVELIMNVLSLVPLFPQLNHRNRKKCHYC